MKSLGQILRETFISLNPRDDIRMHRTWEELSDEKRTRYDMTADAVVRAAIERATPVQP